MKLFSSFILLCLSSVAIAAQPNQIVINVERQDFKPLQDVSWRVMAGAANTTRNQGNTSFSGTGLSVGAEKMMNQKWSLGLQYANINGIQSEPIRIEKQIFTDGSPYWTEIDSSAESRISMGVLSGYAKYSFVNYPVNQWNLLQVNLVGGVSAYSRYQENLQPMYGASVAYNHDNLIGFEIGTKVNLKAEASTNMNLIGYF